MSSMRANRQAEVEPGKDTNSRPETLQCEEQIAEGHEKVLGIWRETEEIPRARPHLLRGDPAGTVFHQSMANHRWIQC